MSNLSTFYVYAKGHKNPWMKVQGIEIPERHSHGIPMFYCQAGGNEILNALGLATAPWVAFSSECGAIITRGETRSEINEKLKKMITSAHGILTIEVIEKEIVKTGLSPLFEKQGKQNAGGFF
uniref:Uncharacterized protein n=1 Tax=viral metagenome TaxID=1070528 RepID=A0A6M3IXH3_9ZZZZ